MHSLILKIGQGPKSSKDLTWEEAKRAMRLLIEQQASPVQTGAFLLALRLKMVSVAELAAFTATAREYVPRVPVPTDVPLVDLPCYHPRRETVHASIAAALVAAAAGAAVLVHGHGGEDDGGHELHAVLDRLGIPVEWDAATAAEAVATVGCAFLDMASYHPPVARFLRLRRELGVTTVFHQVATLLNPARAGSQVIGVSYQGYFEKTAEALSLLGAPRALIVRGVDGGSELSIVTGTKALEVRGERVTPLTLYPKDVGLAAGTVRDMARPAPWRADREADLLRRVLANEVRGGPRDWVLLNAALLLYASGKAASIAAAFPAVRGALESGAAARTLRALVSFRRAPSGDGASLPSLERRRAGGDSTPDHSRSEACA